MAKPLPVKFIVEELEPRLSRDVYPYIHPNPLIRRVFWKRLDNAAALASEGGSALAGGGGSARASSEGSALDFGTGNGFALPYIAERFKSVDGIDLKVNPCAHAIVQKLGLKNVRLLEMSGYKLKLSRKYDAVFALDVLEHFEQLDSAVRQIKAVLAPGGALIVSGPSENLLYRMSRKVFGLKKPEDHYHTADEVFAACGRHFKLEKERNVPAGVPSSVALFRIGRFRN